MTENPNQEVAPWDEEDQALAMASGAPAQFAYLRRNIVRRCEELFFKLDHWSVTDWACALAGEAGEACNEAKKIKRGDGSVEALAKELADVVCYADLFAASQGIDLWKAVVDKFNEVSERYSYPIKMHVNFAKPVSDKGKPFGRCIVKTFAGGYGTGKRVMWCGRKSERYEHAADWIGWYESRSLSVCPSCRAAYEAAGCPNEVNHHG